MNSLVISWIIIVFQVLAIGYLMSIIAKQEIELKEQQTTIKVEVLRKIIDIFLKSTDANDFLIKIVKFVNIESDGYFKFDIKDTCMEVEEDIKK